MLRHLIPGALLLMLVLGTTAMAGPAVGDGPEPSLLTGPTRISKGRKTASRAALQFAIQGESQVFFPRATLRILEAEPLRLPGPGVDCNSPAHWDGEQFHVFTSWFDPYDSIFRSSGSDLLDLNRQDRAEIVGNHRSADGGRWLEATYKDTDGTLYGWYHTEPTGLCGGKPLTAPRIGAMLSFNNGLSWLDLGVVLDAPRGLLNCEAGNGYFAGGHGDFSVILDEEQKFFYFLFSNYSGPAEEQGMAVARMPYGAREAPAGSVVKWYGGDWQEPGLGGRVTPVLPVARPWVHADPDAFWGPAVHFNTHLQAFVILLNRTQEGNGDWRQEGVYAMLADRLDDPSAWTPPERIFLGGAWYPQVIGANATARETDKLAGRNARLFIAGFSNWQVTFHLRPQIAGATAIPCGNFTCIALNGSHFGAAPSVDVRIPGSDEVVASYSGPELQLGNIQRQQVLVLRLDRPDLVEKLAAGGLSFSVVNPDEATWSEQFLLNSGG